MLLIVLSLGCGRGPQQRPSAASDSSRQVTLQLNWYPEHEHGGFYAALIHGHYQDQGLDVRIIPGGSKVAVAHQLVTARADFVLASADEVLLAQSQGARLLALMAPIDQSPRCVMVHQASGITSLGELRGRVALKGGSPFVTFLEKRGFLDQCDVVPFPGGIRGFLASPNYSQQAYNFSEPIQARREGANPRVLMLSDEGFNPYMGMLVTLASTAEADPELLRKFTLASLAGWKAYLADPAETNRHISQLSKEQGEELDEAFLAEGVDALKQICLPADSPQFGKMEAERWQTLQEQMVELDLIPAGGVQFEQAYTNQFLAD